ncbi:MAG: hypothetical protein JST00_00800 [Deltaproteobacteria bacterium]|nr:hypothetical protein [Deltaproteobacteria bacterium]
MSRLTLGGLRTGSPQTMGALRLVPVLRDEAPGDLRIGMRDYGPSIGVVVVEPRIAYLSYVPHGFVVSHTADGSSAALGAGLGERSEKSFVKIHHRMVKSEVKEAKGAPERFRMLPLHLAMEGLLALRFRGPDIVWKEYSEHAARFGLSPRIERSVRGAWLRGFDQALATFEIHPRQVGVLCFVAEAFASAFVVSHPDDYRRLHLSLLEDFYGDLLYQYALLHPELPRAETLVDVAGITSIAQLEGEIARVRDDWREYTALLADGLFGRDIDTETVRAMKPFTLERFLPKLDPNEECHIGERIVRDDGTLEYLKTFRLSHAQVRRAYLLEQLSLAEWNLDAASARLSCTKDELVTRLVNAGFGYLLRPHLALIS